MASIICNGGVRIIPQQPSSLVVAHRQLQDMDPFFSKLQADFNSGENTNNWRSFKKLAVYTQNFASIYQNVLVNTGKALRNEMAGLPDESRKELVPTLTFISRASDAHSILPFMTYMRNLGWWLRGSKYGYPQAFFEDISQFKQFISERIAQSREEKKSYSGLLSRGMDCVDGPFDIVSMVGNILHIQKKVAAMRLPNHAHNLVSAAHIAFANHCELPAGRARALYMTRLDKAEFFATQTIARTLSEVYDSRINVLAPPGKIECIGRAPFASFLFNQVISNSLKATFGAAEKQKMDGGNRNFMYKDYLDLPPIDPRITIRISKTQSHAIVSISDTGMGMSKEMLGRLFVEIGYVAGFTNIKDGNHVSLSTFPHVADLADIEIHVESKIPSKKDPDGGTSFTFKIPLDAPSLRASALAVA